MLQRDYLLEVIGQFVESVTQALLSARAAKDKPAALESAVEVEHDVAGLLDMDPDVAMNLTPDSLVTMMLLSGMGDALAGYVAFALSRVADVYDEAGEAEAAAANRRRQSPRALMSIRTGRPRSSVRLRTGWTRRGPWRSHGCAPQALHYTE